MTIVRDKTFYKSVLSIMFPVALQQAINMGVNMLDTMMLGSFGEVALSASSLANQYYNFFVIFNLGIIGGCSVLCAQYWGAGDRERVYETFAMALRLSAGLAVLFAGITWLFPAEIMRLYSPETAVIEAGTRYLKITTFIIMCPPFFELQIYAKSRLNSTKNSGGLHWLKKTTSPAGGSKKL